MAGTVSRGLRLPGWLWEKLDKLAVGERRKTTQYVKNVLEDHAVKKGLKDSEKVGGKK